MEGEGRVEIKLSGTEVIIDGYGKVLQSSFIWTLKLFRVISTHAERSGDPGDNLSGYGGVP